MFGNKISSSTSCSKWLHETEPGRLDQEFSGRFLKVATHPSRPLGRYTPGVTASTAAARGPQPVSRTRGSPPPVAPPWTARRVVPTGGAVSSPRRGSPRDPPPGSVRAARLWQRVSMATENRTFVATENCTLLGEDVSAGADILPVMPVGRVGLDAGSGATGVLANTRRDAAEPAVT